MAGAAFCAGDFQAILDRSRQASPGTLLKAAPVPTLPGAGTACRIIYPQQAFARIGGLAELMARGVISRRSDYGGQREAGQHSDLLGTSEAYAVIDSMRAAPSRRRCGRTSR